MQPKDDATGKEGAWNPCIHANSMKGWITPLFSWCLLSTHYVLGATASAGDTAVNKTGPDLLTLRTLPLLGVAEMKTSKIMSRSL